MIDIIDTEAKFDALKEEWERIERNPQMRIFQTYAWCRNAWDICVSKEKGAKLWILRWHQDGRDDVVIFPFYIDGKGCLRFIMDRHSDVCNAVYDERHFNRHWAYKDAAEAICENRAINSVFLQKMDGGSEALNHLAVMLAGSVVSRDNAYSWVESGKCDDFIVGQNQLRSKDKADLKSIRRKTDKNALKVLTALNGDAFPSEIVDALKRNMLSNTNRKEDFLSADLASFIRSVYEYNRCRIVILEDEGEVKALNFILQKGQRLLSWVFLYSDVRTSAALYVKLMSEMARETGFVFDFGVGAYSYKTGTFRPALAITFSLRFAKSLFRQFLTLAGANIRLLKDMLKPRLKKH